MNSGMHIHGVPGSKEHRARRQALRTVALLEIGKGAVAMVAALSLYWVDPSDVAGAFLAVLHISPDAHIAHFLFGLADKLSNVKLWHVILGASVYTALRFAEAYGLWRQRAWGEWIALISGALYLPFEIRKLTHDITPFFMSALIVNLAIVGFMFYLRIYVPRKEAACRARLL